MDFKVDIDKFNYIVGQYDSLLDNLDQGMKDFVNTIDELSSGWDGIAKVTYYGTAIVWMNECNDVIEAIKEFKENLDSSLPDADNLLSRGEKLTI